MLDEKQIAEIAARPVYPWVRFERDSDEGEAKHLPRGLVLSTTERDSLIATVRRLQQERLRLLNLVRYCRHELLDEKLITQDEFASLLEEGSAAHLETYDQQRAQIAELQQENESQRKRIEELENA